MDVVGPTVNLNHISTTLLLHSLGELFFYKQVNLLNLQCGLKWKFYQLKDKKVKITIKAKCYAKHHQIFENINLINLINLCRIFILMKKKMTNMNYFS